MNTDDFAVRVGNVSKIYRLWDSPRDRLVAPVRRVANMLLPAGFRKNGSQTGFREFHALHDVSFDIRKGESWGFIGVNGSGKSTLLKIISGNLRPSMGRVEVEGKAVILDYGSGFNSEFTGEENIYMKAALLGLTGKQISERFKSIVEFAEIGDFIRQPTKTYSSGMNARLGFAIMAHVDADIIITDEALAVGDVFFVQKCMAYIRSFLKRGTFLFVSHSTNDVLSLCQHAVWLEHGRIKVIGSAQEATNAYLGTQALARAEEMPTEKEKLQEAVGSNVQELVLNQPALAKLMDYVAPRVVKDARAKYLDQSSLRNDIQIPEFVFDKIGFGAGGARISNVTFSDEQGAVLSWIVGGELVTLSIDVLAERDLLSPIVGFQLLDRLGQSLIADNTYLVTRDQALRVPCGTTFANEFTFQMPLLPVGDYVVRAAVAVGEEEGSAVPLHIIDAALVVRSTASGARHGLVGVPMHTIRVKCKETAAAIAGSSE